jgi:hypothetical protein
VTISKRQELLILYYLKLVVIGNMPVVVSSDKRPPLTEADYVYENNHCFVVVKGEEKVSLKMAIEVLSEYVV